MKDKPKKEEPQTLANDILMRSIKILDIGYITCIYVAFSMSAARLADAVMGKFDEKTEMKKSIPQITLELILLLWAYGVLIYVARNVAEIIPFPLNGVQGFDHLRVKELKNGTVFTLTFLMFCTYVREKVIFYYKRVSNSTESASQTMSTVSSWP